MLRQGAWVWQWRNTDTGEVSASITIYGDANELRLSYSVNGSDTAQVVSIERTACGFGGSRPWFGCPCCGRRVAKLFLLRRRFACSRCQHLTYASRCEDEIGRLWRRQAKLERKLGPTWARPRYMHHATHERIVKAIIETEARREAVFVELCGRLLLHLR